jgi:hypothetical protein
LTLKNKAFLENATQRFRNAAGDFIGRNETR